MEKGAETENWGHEETETPTPLTMQTMTELCKNIKEQRNLYDSLKAESTKVDKAIGELESKLIEYLEMFGMSGFKTDQGNFIISTKKKYNNPSGEENKQALYEYLKSTGQFEAVVSLNNAVLNTWLKQEIEVKEKEGHEGWKPPGIGECNIYKTINLRKV